MLSEQADQKLGIFGAGAGRLLCEIIKEDPRFKGDLSAFYMWLHPWRDYSAVLSSWRTPDDAATWARLYGIPPRKLIDRSWIRKAPLLVAREGRKGLYEAILEDSRFGGRFSSFSQWWKHGSGDVELVKRWITKEDALMWAVQERLDTRCLSDETAFRSARRRTHKAILQDPRFQGKFKIFKVWLNIDTAHNSIVAGWRDKRDAVQWALERGMNPSQLWVPEVLASLGHMDILQGILSDTRFAGDFTVFRNWVGAEPDYVEVVKSWRTSADAVSWAVSENVSWDFLEDNAHSKELEQLRSALLSDPRFGGRISEFRIWLGLHSDYRALVRSWKKPQDALAWAASKGISAANLVRRSWLIEVSPLPVHQGGTGEPLKGLVEAIVSDRRFKGDFLCFRRWLGVNNWSAIVSSWKNPKDARSWAQAKGISWKGIAARERRSQRHDCDEEKRSLFEAIVSDPRFRGSFSKFLSWLGLPQSL
jgi:hypothetical protein